VPKDCEFQFDMRTLPSASADTLYQEIRGYADALTREMKSVDPEAGIALEWACQVAGLEATEADSIVQWAMRLARSSSTGKVSYGTEAGLFQELGIPTVVLGPGDIAEAHRPNEFVSLDQLAQCQAFLERVVGGAFLS
jgi:acetylornithine deacetylase